VHITISQLSLQAERAAAELDIPSEVGFQRARKLVREELQRLGIAAEIEKQCARILIRDEL
jgi:hypothetical protein